MKKNVLPLLVVSHNDEILPFFEGIDWTSSPGDLAFGIAFSEDCASM
jgi:hypothetical protein